jgi:hypothetical protein
MLLAAGAPAEPRPVAQAVQPVTLPVLPTVSLPVIAQTLRRCEKIESATCSGAL